MKRYVFSVATLFLFLTHTVAAQKIEFPDKTFTQREICRTEKCEPGNKGTPLSLKKPYKLDISDKMEAPQVVLQVLGRTTAKNDYLLTTLRPCSADGTSPFSSDHVSKSGSDFTTFTYETKKGLTISAGGKAQINQQLQNSITDKAQLIDVQNRLEAEYKRLSNRKLTIKGTYTEWALNTTALDRLATNEGFNGCKNFIRDNDRRIVTAVGLVEVDIKVEGDSIDTAGAGIQSILRTVGINADVGLIIKREVLNKFGAATENIYRIPFFRHAEFINF